MATTSPDGIVYPTSSGSTQLWTHYQNLADSVQTALTAMKTWTSWTPVFNTGPTGIGSGGVAEGSYLLVGDLFIGSFRLELGTSPTISGTFELNLPVPIFAWSGVQMALGNWVARDASPTVYYSGSIVAISQSPSRCHFAGAWDGPSSSKRVSDDTPMTWVATDVLTGQLTYKTT